LKAAASSVELPEPACDISVTEHYAAEIKATIARGLDAVDAYIATDGYLLFVHPDVPRNTRH
jgi:hypothetical protein